MVFPDLLVYKPSSLYPEALTMCSSLPQRGEDEAYQFGNQKKKILASRATLAGVWQ